MSYSDLGTVLEENFEETVGLYRHLHMYPELSFEEVKTRIYIIEKLTEYGYTDLQTNVGGGGILATLNGDYPGPTLALRADYDALPILEEADVPYRSKIDGVMHACGHDAHTSTLLSVAKVLKPLEHTLHGKVVFLFQHAEEVHPGGAKGIIESGALDDIDFIYGLHVSGAKPFDGRMSYCSGYSQAASDRFEIFIQGKGGHGASPHMTIDTTLISAYLIQQLQSIVSRTRNPIESGVVTVATFKTGNQTGNIISDSSYLKGTVRTYSPELRDLIEDRMKTLVADICKTHGADSEVKYARGYPSLYNHPEHADLVAGLFAEIIDLADPSMGGEDFAYYLQAKPGAFFFVNAGLYPENNYPHHHPKFAIDERCMLVGAKAFLKLVDYYLDGSYQGKAGE